MDAIGITGRSGSGKSRVARELARLLPGSAVLPTDAYYRDLSGLEPAEREAVNFDDPSALDWDLLASQLDALSRGQPIQVPSYDFSRHVRLPAAEPFPPCATLVLEGLFALCDRRIRSMFRLAVFLDAGEDVCLARRIARDVAQRGRSEDSVRRQWQEDAEPMFRRHVMAAREDADLVLDASLPPAESAAAVVQALRGSGSGTRHRPVNSKA